MRESEDDEGGFREEKRGRKKRKEGRFGVESKFFEIGVEEKQGRFQVVIEESKGGVSSWVRLGPRSVEALLDSLKQCIKAEDKGKWERGWRENGRVYSLVRDENKAGMFIRLGVVDKEKRRYNIFIPKGRGEGGGWNLMVEMLQKVAGNNGVKEKKQEERAMVETSMNKSFVEMVKGSEGRGGEVVKVEVREEEIRGNLRKLEYCLVGSWSPSLANGMDMERFGWLMARTWGLQGNLGLARMETGRVLLEFQHVGEAERVLAYGSRRVGAVQLGLERWRPRCGCEDEGGSRKEVWVKILGLPVSLWDPSILRKVGDKCGGFVAMDPLTKKMVDLEGARILVKRKNGGLPSRVDIVVEEVCYSLYLWWEVRPEMRKSISGSSLKGIYREEVRGDAMTRATQRVGEERSARPEALLRTADGTDEQVRGVVGEGTGEQVGAGYGARVSAELDQVDRLLHPGPSSGRTLYPKAQRGEKKGPSPLKGLKLKGVVSEEAGLGIGPSYSKSDWWIGVGESPGLFRSNGGEGDQLSPLQPESRKGKPERGSIWKRGDFSEGRNREDEFLKIREKEDAWKQQMVPSHSVTDRALIAEELRYGSVLIQRGGRDSGYPSSSSHSFDRTPEGEFYDHSGVACEVIQNEIPLNTIKPVVNGGGRWELAEDITVNDNDKEWEKGSMLTVSQEAREERENGWEECNLAKFSQFLGFPIEGLEKEIVNFLAKIRKRREKIYSRGVLEKTKFERELKRLECSINYEGGSKQRSSSQDRGCQLIEVVRSIGVGRFLDWRAVDASGTAGGILVCWDKRLLELLDWEEGQFTISCRFRKVEDGAVWVFTGVYGPFTKNERDCMWDEIGAIRGLWEEPWCVGGDFNVIRSQNERNRQGRISATMRKFAQVIDELGLIDLPLQGGDYTWSGGPNNRYWARLDRFLVTPSWMDQFSSVIQKRLPRPASDHFPIVLEGGTVRRGPSPFRFENMWLKVDGFQELIHSWWQGIEVRGSASFRLEDNKAAALQLVDHWDRVGCERRLSEEETESKKEAKDSYAKWVSLEETHWRQHSRELWLREGDNNTGYFHRMVAAHRRFNHVDRIKIGGVWLTEEKDVREGVANAFQHLLTENSDWKADIEGLQLEQLNQQEAENLEQPFSEEEIHSALMEMNGDKAPGPDGFTMAFWQRCWVIVKEEVLEMFKEFYEQSAFIKSMNSTFLVLIPKKGGLRTLGNSGQSVSWGGCTNYWPRQILDASLIANEAIDAWQKRGERGLICKLDIDKAYDSLNWQFLMKVMRKMGFGSRWLGWMWSCISTAKFSVLVNGVSAGFFPSSKGLRQGDPLSPYLFVMGMEVLSNLIRRVVEGGFLSGCRIRGGGRQPVHVSHLLFADDTIVFCEARKEYLTYLSWILFWFEAVSGLRINLEKSELIPVGEVEEMEEMAAELGCKVGSMPSVYLGLPLGARNKSAAVWDGVEEKMRRRLAHWKRQYISKGGRLILIKSTMASIPLYQMSLFRMPKLVARRLEKLQRDFLWGGGNLERKVHIVNWKIVCTEKEKGGLGLRKLVPLNKALLGKWIWRFACEKENLWRQVLVAKYGQEGFGWMTKKTNGTFGVGVWKEIMKEKDWCWENMAFRMGNGTRIRFWNDLWCGCTVLSQRFPHLYGMAAHRNGTVEDMWDQNVGQGDWDVRFVRRFNDWELDLVGNLLHTLRGFNPTLEEDAVFWKGRKNGKFKVKEAYNLVLLGARCSRLIGSREEGGISLIGASCVDVKRKL
ncbi:LINE-1 retrotransposable element ORF2 protein [Vitis vinifera]|uniref:LINE-1 retrotransposable element ORF2 protein n=1 Tax=Vitis vinifera TaxID=29760 RepID=A0A438F6K8_VITVI|nr:LINE-1 retrotransposable element ORF2 protein [Vitis vinifera]